MLLNNKQVLNICERSLWGVGKGINLMVHWYPWLPRKIDQILVCEDQKLFPDWYESPTGYRNTWGWWWPFSNEEWQAPIENEHYAFPGEYRRQEEIKIAIETSKLIQESILNSSSYKKALKKVQELGILNKTNYKDTPRYKWLYNIYDWDLDNSIFDDNGNLKDWYQSGADKRILQIEYSIEEKRYEKNIIKLIWDPIRKVHNDIKERIENWEELYRD